MRNIVVKKTTYKTLCLSSNFEKKDGVLMAFFVEQNIL